METHLRYIEREGVDRDGGMGHAYGPTTDHADLADFPEIFANLDVIFVLGLA